MKLDTNLMSYHVAMLNDKTRTSRYLANIREVVRPGDIVVDIGTGTGICAIAAARAGAQHVYAIEAGPVARVARTLFDVNRATDRITLLRAWSTEVRVPRRADVLISELIGNEPLAERVIGITKDALRRFLKPNARLLPSGLKIFGLPVTIPDRELSKRTFSRDVIQNWQSWYGIEFNPLNEVNLFSNLMDFINPYTMRLWKTLSPPVLLADVDFKMWKGHWIDTRRTVTVNASGRLNGLIVYFELRVGATTFLSTHPASVDEYNHWLSPVYLFTDPVTLQTGDHFDVIYQYWFAPGISGCEVNPKRM